MQRILRTSLPLVALLVAAIALVACGGDDGGRRRRRRVDADTDVNTLLDQTFSRRQERQVRQARPVARVDVSGDGSSVNGPIDVKLSGPFQSQGEARAAEVRPRARGFDGAGPEHQGRRDLAPATRASSTSTARTTSSPTRSSTSSRQGYEQAPPRAADGSGQSLASLGIDPRKLAQGPEERGRRRGRRHRRRSRSPAASTCRSCSTTSTRCSSKAGSLGVPNAGQLPTKLTDEQSKQVEDAIKDVNVEIDTGKDDSILRRMKFDLDAEDPPGAERHRPTSTSTCSCTDLNEEPGVQRARRHEAVRRAARPARRPRRPRRRAAAAPALGLGGSGSGSSGRRLGEDAARSTRSASRTPVRTWTRRRSAPTCSTP